MDLSVFIRFLMAAACLGRAAAASRSSSVLSSIPLFPKNVCVCVCVCVCARGGGGGSEGERQTDRHKGQS